MLVLWLVALASAVTPVEQVATMLSEMKSVAATNFEEEQARGNKVAAYCSVTTESTEAAQQEEALALAECEANVATLTVEVESESQTEAESNSELTELEASREAEKTAAAEAAAEYATALAEYDGAVHAVERAIQVLATQADMSSEEVTKLLQTTKKALPTLVLAKVETHALAREIGTVRDDPWSADEHLFDDVELSTTTSAYTSRSGSITETLETVLSSIEGDREELVSAETTRRAAYEETKHALDEQAEGTRERYNQAVATRQAKETELAAATQAEIVAREAAEKTAAFLAEHEASCKTEIAASAKAADQYQQEEKAIDAAISALTGVLPSLLHKRVQIDKAHVHVAQAGKSKKTALLAAPDFASSALRATADALVTPHAHATVALPRRLGGREDKREKEAQQAEKLGSFLRLQAEKLSSSRLEKLADQAFEAAAEEPTYDASNYSESAGRSYSEDDPLGRVKTMIENLIIEMKQQLIDDAEHKAYCDEELAKNAHNTKTAETGITDHSASLAELEGEQGRLELQIEDTTRDLAERREARQNATDLRNETRTVHEQAIAEADEAVTTVNAAMELLRAFYANTSIFPEPPAQSTNVLAMLDVVQSDYQRTSDELTATEAKLEKEYKELDTEAAVAIASMEKDITYFNSTLTAIVTQIPLTKADLNTSQTDLNASEAMYDQLHPLCLAPESYEDRKAARDQEIAALKESLELMEQQEVLLQAPTAKQPPIHFDFNRDTPKELADKAAEKQKQQQPKAPKGVLTSRLAQLFTPEELKMAAATDGQRAALLAHRQRVEKTLHAQKREEPAVEGASYSDAVDRVVAILADIEADVQEDIAEDQQTYTQMQTWCSSNLAAATEFNSAGQSRDEELVLLLESTSAQIAQLEVDTAKLESDITKGEAALETAKELRESEHEAYQAETKSLIESITALQGAIVVLSKHNPSGNNTNRSYDEVVSDYEATLGLMTVGQNASRSKPTVTLTAKLQTILTKSDKVSAEQTQEILTAITAREEPASERTFWDKEGAPGTNTITPASRQIFGILNELMEQFQADVATAEEKEAGKQQAYEDLVESKEAELDSFRASLATKSANLASSKLTLASSEQELTDLRVSLSAGYELVNEINTQCTDFENDFSERNATRHEELSALQDALAHLQGEDAEALSAADATALVHHAVQRNLTNATAALAPAPAAAVNTASAAPAKKSAADVLSGFLHKYGLTPGKAAAEAKRVLAAEPPLVKPAPAEPVAAKVSAAVPEPAKPAVASPEAVRPVAATEAAQPAAPAVTKPAAPAAHPARVVVVKDAPVRPAKNEAAIPAPAKALWSKAPRAKALLELAQTPGLTSDILKDVIDQIEPLAAILVEEKIEETRVRDLCVSEIHNAGLAIDQANTSLLDAERRSAREAMTLEQTETQLENANSELNQLQASLNASKSQRAEEHAAYAQEVAEQQAVSDLLVEAKQILARFYDKQALVQTRARLANVTAADLPTLEKAPEYNNTGKAHGSGGGVMAILDMLAEEALQVIEHVVDAEEAAVDQYTAEVNSYTQSISLKEREIVELTSTHGEATARKVGIDEEAASLSSQIEGLQTYLAATHGKCDVLLEHYAENQEHRQQEIDNLNQAKAYLAGQVTSFLQVPAAQFLGRA